MDASTRPRDRAIGHIADERYTDAAEAYTLDAYAVFSGQTERSSGLYASPERSRAGRGLASLATAAVCHRIAGDHGRASALAGQGILVAGELRDAVLESAVERANCNEWIGDFRSILGDRDNASEAYDRAAAAYADAGIDSPATETGRPFLQAGTELLAHLSRPDDLGWDDIHGNGDDALTRRVSVKRSRTASIVDARIDAGKLHAPRGSTEYNTGRFRCPVCGADDVNYVANTTLCLRCSAPTDRT